MAGVVADLSWSWLAAVDEATLRSDVDRVVDTLVALQSDRLSVDEAEVQTVFRRLLGACTEAGPGALTRTDATRVLFPLFLYLGRTERMQDFAGELRALSHREDIRSVHSLSEYLEPFSERQEPSSDALRVIDAEDAAGADLVRRLLGGLPELSTAEEEQLALPGAALAWASRRKSVELPRRVAVDAWLLHALTATTLHIPSRLAESLYSDDDIWATEEISEFVQSLPEPLAVDRTGLSASALLNSRMRTIRPRLFLRFPDTLVVEPIGRKADTDRLTRDIVDSIAEPLLRTVATIDVENRRRPGLTPRKGSFKDLREFLAQALAQLGYQFVGQSGDLVSFDPREHVPFESIEQGTTVQVVRPGLRRRHDTAMTVKVQVTSQIEAAEPSEVLTEIDEETG